MRKRRMASRMPLPEALATQEHSRGETVATSGQAILSISGLSYRYNALEDAALNNVTLGIPAGAVTAILGPNGSGKTTLLRLLLGVLPPASGAIWLDGQPQEGYPRRKRSQLLGLVPQDEHIPFDFSVLEYVLLGRAPYLGPLAVPGEVDRRIAVEALNRVGMAYLQDRPLPNLSGGERQLAIVARALAQQPRILLLDEPTAHLDLGNQARILELVRELSVQGITVVMTTHDPNLASSVADFAVLMRRGQILDAGPAGEMLTGSRLSATYDVPVQVFRVANRCIILLP